MAKNLGLIRRKDSDNRNLNLHESAMILFRIDSGEDPTLVCRDYKINVSKIVQLRTLKLSYAPLQEAYREATRSYRDLWVNDAASFMRKGLAKISSIAEECFEPADLDRVVHAVETVGNLLSEQKIVNATSYALLHSNVDLQDSEAIDTEFSEVLLSADSPINVELLEKYDLAHMAEDYGLEL